jgi:hypothetical protein
VRDAYGKAEGGVLHVVMMISMGCTLLKKFSLIRWLGDSTGNMPWHAAAVVSV